MPRIPVVRRTRVEDIRSIWRKETEFSDWLVTEEGLAMLAEDIGLEVENPRRECRPGDFPCDIVGNVLGDENHVVVIENQYGKTDHDHLGKLLTYAAVHQAMTGVWIAEQASNDHRQVLEWLNENTPPTVNLYLCELKAYRIGDSPVAPHLELVCRPNTTQKIKRAEGSVAERERYAWRQEFWEEIHERIRATHPPYRLQRPGPDHWSSVSIGRSGFHLNLLLTPKNQSVGVDLYIQPEGWKQSAYEQLAAQRDAITAEIGEQLRWLPLPDKKTSRILLETKLDPKNPAEREAVKNWFAEKTVLFYRVFRDRVLALQPPLDADENPASNG